MFPPQSLLIFKKTSHLISPHDLQHVAARDPLDVFLFTSFASQLHVRLTLEAFQSLMEQKGLDRIPPEAPPSTGALGLGTERDGFFKHLWCHFMKKNIPWVFW